MKIQKEIHVEDSTYPEMRILKKIQVVDSTHPEMKIQEGGLSLVPKIQEVQIFWTLKSLTMRTSVTEPFHGRITEIQYMLSSIDQQTTDMNYNIYQRSTRNRLTVHCFSTPSNIF
jgi:hypothetical protein